MLLISRLNSRAISRCVHFFKQWPLVWRVCRNRYQTDFIFEWPHSGSRQMLKDTMDMRGTKRRRVLSQLWVFVNQQLVHCASVWVRSDRTRILNRLASRAQGWFVSLSESKHLSSMINALLEWRRSSVNSYTGSQITKDQVSICCETAYYSQMWFIYALKLRKRFSLFTELKPAGLLVSQQVRVGFRLDVNAVFVSLGGVSKKYHHYKKHA